VTKFKRARANWEKKFIRDSLIINNWNVSETAKDIGVERAHLHRKMNRYGIKRETA
jgi:two-component system nitrogen regulation response regulator NtrX